MANLFLVTHTVLEQRWFDRAALITLQYAVRTDEAWPRRTDLQAHAYALLARDYPFPKERTGWTDHWSNIPPPTVQPLTAAQLAVYQQPLAEDKWGRVSQQLHSTLVELPKR